MHFKVKGTVRHWLPPESVKTRNGSAMKGGFILNYGHDDDEHDAHFTLWGKVFDSTPVLKTGDEVEVTFQPDSREWKSRWYTDLRTIKVEYCNLAEESDDDNLDGFPAGDTDENTNDIPDLYGEDDLPF